MARKAIANRQKKIVSPPRRAASSGVSARAPRTAGPEPATGACLVIAPEALAKGLKPLVGAFSRPVEIATAGPSGQLPPGSDRAEVFFRWWGEGAERATSGILGRAPGLRWIHTPSAGVDHLPLAEIGRRGILLTNGRGIHAVPLAEAVLHGLLARAKRAREHLENQAAGRYEKLQLDELNGRTLLLFGYGSIGREIARRASAFGMRVIAVRKSGRRERGLARAFSPRELPAALSLADAVVLAAPLTAGTRGVFSAEVFAAMKDDCHFVNVSRGELVREEDLVEGLRRGKPAFASLDVFEREPLAPESPLWRLPNVRITPHDAWSSPRTRARSTELFLANLRSYLGGRPLRNRVDPERGF